MPESTPFLRVLHTSGPYSALFYSASWREEYCYALNTKRQTCIIRMFVMKSYRLGGRRLTRVPRVRKVESSRIPKADQILHSVATVHHRFNIYSGSCVALALCHEDGHHKLIIRFVGGGGLVLVMNSC